MRARKVTWAAAAGIAVVFGLGLSVPAASAAPASLPLPSCSATDPGTAPNLVGHCWYVPGTGISQETPNGGAAGYLAADDEHTHYRFVSGTFGNTAQLVQLNGTNTPAAVGVELCDPNIQWAAQIGDINDTASGAGNFIYYAAGFYNSPSQDPCIIHSLLVTNPTPATCPLNGNGHNPNFPGPAFCGSFSSNPLAIGDQIGDLALYYTPGGHFFHQISYGFCDVTQGFCRQAYLPWLVTLNLWEAGAGVFTPLTTLTAPPANVLTTMTSAVTCYSCGSAVPIAAIQPVNPFGIGGLEEVQLVNGSGQVVMGPDNSLSAAGTFTLYNGSTSP